MIGGDLRQYYLVSLLRANGYQTAFYDVVNLQNHAALQDILDSNDLLILPYPLTKDGVNIHITCCEEKIPLETVATGKPVFAGGNYKNFINYAKDPALIEANSALTAEAAVSIAVENSEKSIFGSKILVIGYGNIGKLLADDLQTMGGQVTVTVRDTKHLPALEKKGFHYIYMEDLKDLFAYDMIFNTAPAPVLDASRLATCQNDVLIIDLASMPGGTDFSFAQQNKIRALLALSLPAKKSPKTAAQIIYNSVINNIQREEKL